MNESDCEVCPVKKVLDMTDELKEKLLIKVPNNTKEHLTSARKEVLLALRSAIDAVLEKDEKKTSKSKAKKVKVE
jgi:hypothetical protein